LASGGIEAPDSEYLMDTPQPVITAAIASNEKRKMKNEKLSRNLRILLILNF
jgi:hypothetical protein